MYAEDYWFPVTLRYILRSDGLEVCVGGADQLFTSNCSD